MDAQNAARKFYAAHVIMEQLTAEHAELRLRMRKCEAEMNAAQRVLANCVDQNASERAWITYDEQKPHVVAATYHDDPSNNREHMVDVRVIPLYPA